MTPETAILLALALPLGGALLTGLLGARPNVREGATLLTGAALLTTVVSLLPEVLAGGRPEAAARM